MFNMKIIKEILLEQLEKTKAYNSWKRKTVALRGISNKPGEHNYAGAMLGRGLYTAALANKALARQYGKVYFVVNARPKNPIVFENLNRWEIWFYANLVIPYSNDPNYPDKREFFKNNTIEDAVQALGYDGIEIKGREYVNFTPNEDEIRYFDNEDDLIRYYNNAVIK